jgi:hypothetical protein
VNYANERTKIQVMVDTRDGERIFGSIFMSLKDRLSDVLNDDRRFLPIETSNGSDTQELEQDGCVSKTIIIHKDIITKVHEV